MQSQIEEQVISILDLPTEALTIAPTSCTVTRDIPGITLRPGPNYIAITDITAYADEASIRVSGLLSSAGIDEAVVTEMTIEHVAPTVRDKSDDSDVSDSESEATPQQPAALVDARKRLIELTTEQGLAKAALTSVNERWRLLKAAVDAGVVNVRTETAVVPSLLAMYEKERKKLAVEEVEGDAAVKEATAKVIEAQRRVKRAERRWKRDTKKPKAPAKTGNIVVRRPRNEAHQGPQSHQRVLCVRLTIQGSDATSAFSGPSVTASTATGVKTMDDAQPPPASPSLRLSYVVTKGAGWSPGYDLRLDTTQRTGELTYKAHITNTTGEYWRDASVTLSSSQSAFTGLDDRAPTLTPWRAALVDKIPNCAEPSVLLSAQEQAESGVPRPYAPVVTTQAQLPDFQQQLMLLEQQNMKRVMMARAEQDRQSPQYSQMPMQQAVQMQQQAHQQMQMNQQMAQQMAPPAPPPAVPAADASEDENSEDEDEDGASDTGTLPALTALRTATSRSLTHGTTTTHALPARTSIPSSPHTSRSHTLTTLRLPSLVLTHLTVPKLRAATFQRATLRNTGATALHRGPCAITLDGTYIGATTIPRTAPAAPFTVPLGIDTAVLVRYDKPTQHAASAAAGAGWLGSAGSDATATYTRAATLHSARPGAVTVTLVEQVPVSQDGALKVRIVKPVGLEGAKGKVEVEEGVSVALGRDGEVRWEVRLEERQTRRVELVWEVRRPEGRWVVGEQEKAAYSGFTAGGT
ncbi:hypothetical protein EDC01DRAFT_780303 [Geopyxis carbonaria]|nr:hypothetical protein EDC01DRAFT_780303 [Geopyxis carbonaria]